MIHGNYSCEGSLIRCLFVLVDLSKYIERHGCYLTNLFLKTDLINFFILFLENNPLAQLGVIFLKDGLGKMIVNLTNDIEIIKQKISMEQYSPSGELSLFNGLALSISHLKNLPDYYSKEIFFIHENMTFCDPEDPRSLDFNNIKLSIISINAEVYICHHLSAKTNGIYQVINDKIDLNKIMNDFAKLSSRGNHESKRELILIGFPIKTNSKIGFCSCHLSPVTENGYICPNCHSKICSVPVSCPVCRLNLVNPLQIVRAQFNARSGNVIE